MEKVVRFCLSQSVFNNVLYVVLLITGAYSLLSSPIERYPNINMGDIYISTFLYGAAPVDIEKQVTSKMEKEIRQVKDVEYTKATSSRNRCEIKVHYKDGSDFDEITSNIKLRLESIQKDLPSYVKPFTVMEAKVNEWAPVIRFNIFGNHDKNALNLIANDLKILLEGIDGVSKAQFINEDTQEYHIKLSPKLLRKFGIPFQSVVHAVETSNVNVPMGSLQVGDKEIFLTADEKVKSNEDVMKIIIRRDGDGNFVRLADVVSEAVMSTRKPVLILTADGSPCLGLQIHKTETGNAIDIKRKAMKIADEFREAYKDKADFQYVITDDSTKTINESVDTLSSSLIVGIICVYFVMLWMIGFKNAFLSIIGVPFSFLVTMIIFRFTGNSINEISLFGFILVSGMLVGDAIVILENIHRHRELGVPLFDAAVKGTSEVIVPVVASSFTTIAAFSPLLMMTGSVGAFFSILPKAVIFALLASLFEALFMLPLHYIILTPKSHKIKKQEIKPNQFIVSLNNVHLRILRKCLDYKLLSLGAVAVLASFAFGALALSFTGQSNLIRIKFFPDTYPEYFITIETPIATPLEKTNQYLVDISNEVKKNGNGEYSVVSAMAGGYIDEDYKNYFGYHLGMVTVSMPPLTEQKFADYPTNNPKKHLDTVLERVRALVPSDVHVSIRPSYEGPPKGKPINIRIYGQNERNVNILSDKLMSFMQTDERLKNLANLKNDLSETRTVATMRIKELKAKDYYLSALDILGVGAGLIDGRIVGQFRTMREDVDMKVMIDEKELKRPEDILNIPIIEDAKSPVLISDVAKFEYLPEISSLNRYNGQRAVEITAEIKEDLENRPTLTQMLSETYKNFVNKTNSESMDLSPQKVNNIVQEYYKTIAGDYPGASVNFEGEFKTTQDSYDSLAMSFIIAILIMYVIIAWLFQSYLQPFIILTTVIFASIGVIIGLLFTREDFTINVFIGVVGLAGVAVNDSIVLLDFVNSGRRNGMTLRQAIMKGCELRMRAIFLTTVTTILGLLPTAVGFPHYSPTWGGMAISFVSGLSISTILTMFTVPVLYEMLETAKMKILGKDPYAVPKKIVVKKIVKKVIKKQEAESGQ